MLKIWGRRNSINVKKALWCAEEIGVPYELTEAGGAFGAVSESLNPNRLVPVIEDDGFVLWESNAIVRYLAAKYGSAPFYPDKLEARASADKWLDWPTSSLVAPYRDIFWNLVRTPPEKRDMAAVERGAEKCGQLLAIPDAALAEAPFLTGEALGMGDIALGCFAYGWFEMPFTRPDLPHLAAWYRKLLERPAYRETVAIGLS